jgi:hypothetical protein
MIILMMLRIHDQPPDSPSEMDPFPSRTSAEPLAGFELLLEPDPLTPPNHSADSHLPESATSLELLLESEPEPEPERGLELLLEPPTPPDQLADSAVVGLELLLGPDPEPLPSLTTPVPLDQLRDSGLELLLELEILSPSMIPAPPDQPEASDSS